MNYSQPSLRSASTAAGNKTTGAESSARETAKPTRTTPGSDGLMAYTTSYNPTADRRTISTPLSAADKRANDKARQAHHERVRLLVAGAVTLCYVAFAGLMLLASLGHQSNGITARYQAGQWVVSWVVPSGLAYDRGVRPGAILSTPNGALPAGNPEKRLIYRSLNNYRRCREAIRFLWTPSSR